MQTVKIELETVTPLFLSGATQREPELRVPTLRGALRYWLRALLGSQYDEKATFQQESQVFGNTEQRSAIGVRLMQTSKKLL